MNGATFIKNLYKNKTYLDKYGGDVMISTAIILTFLSIFGYYYFLGDIKALQKDWKNIRCNPKYLPFAGIINAPRGQSSAKYAAKNFAECSTDVLKRVAMSSTGNINFVDEQMNKNVGSTSKTVSAMKGSLSGIKGSTGDTIADLHGTLFNTLSPLTTIIIRIRNIMNQISAVGITSLYTLKGTSLTMQSSLYWIPIILIIVFLVLMAVAVGSFGLAALIFPFPFGFIPAIALVIVGAGAFALLLVSMSIGIPAIITSNRILYLTRDT